MDIKTLPTKPPINKTIGKPATPPKSEPPKEKEPGDSVILKGLAGAGKAVLGSAGFAVGGALGGIKGVVTGAACDAAKPSDKLDASAKTEPSKVTKFLRHLGAATGMAVGVALGLSFAPAGLAIAAGTTAVAAIAGAGVGATTPEVLPRMAKGVLGAAKGFKEGGMAGWNLAQKPFQTKPPKESPPKAG